MVQLPIAKEEVANLPLLLKWLRQYEFPHKLGICERLFGRQLNRKGICWVETSTGLIWKLNLEHSCDRWIVFGKYEGPHFYHWAKSFLPEDGIIVDSGANIGQVLLYLAEYVPQGKVIAFEPGRKQADWLADCLAVNPQLPVELIRSGLGETAASLFLSPHGAHGGQSQISETEGEAIEIVSLTQELRNRGIAQVDLWKLDVEGYEINALEGAREMLASQSIRALLIELAFANGQLLRDYLAKFGYNCHFFDKKGSLFQPKSLPEHTNGLFLPVQK